VDWWMDSSKWMEFIVLTRFRASRRVEKKNNYQNCFVWCMCNINTIWIYIEHEISIKNLLRTPKRKERKLLTDQIKKTAMSLCRLNLNIS
jgi:hypothetical protein